MKDSDAATPLDWPGVAIGEETIQAYLEDLIRRGRSQDTVRIYAVKLKTLYNDLPTGKRITQETLLAWREDLLAQGYSPGTVNTHLSAVNGLLDFLGRRDLQLIGRLELNWEVQPELTRGEYLRLLQAARVLNKKRTYLLIKVFALTGLRVGELPQLTVEAVKIGQMLTGTSGDRRCIRLPVCLSQEMLAYIQRQGRCLSPGVGNHCGGPR